MTGCDYNGGASDFIKGDGTCISATGSVLSSTFDGQGVVQFYKGSFPERGTENIVYVNKTVDKSYLWDEATQQYVSADSKEYIKVLLTEPDIGSMEEGVLYIDSSSESGFMNIAGNKVAVFKPTIVRVQTVNDLVIAEGKEDRVYFVEDTKTFYMFDSAVPEYVQTTAELNEVKAEADLSQEVDLPDTKLYITVSAGGLDIEDSTGTALPLENVWKNTTNISYRTSDIGNIAKEDVSINGVLVRADKVKVHSTDTLEVTLTETLLYQGTTIGVNR